MPSLPAHAIDARLRRHNRERRNGRWTGARPKRTSIAAALCAYCCRCFPGKNSSGSDRVPSPDEIRNCSSWMDEEIRILKPRLVIPVGRLAITQFVECANLEKVIGCKFRVHRAGHVFDLIPLPHPSGVSPWHKISPGKELLKRALTLIARHPAIRELRTN